MPKRLKKPPTTRFQYKFETLTDGEYYEFVQGVDFVAPMNSFRSNACTWARNHGYKVQTTKTDEKTICVRFTPDV